MTSIEPTDAEPVDDVAPRDRLIAIIDIPRGHPLRVPTRQGSSAERALATANDVARADAVASLAQLLPGYDPIAAGQAIDDRRFQVLDAPQLCDRIGGLDRVDRLLNGRDHAVGPTGMSFSHAERSGHQPPPPGVARTGDANGICVDVGGLSAALADQWTAILNGADRFDPAVREVNDLFVRAVGARVNTSLSLSYGDAPGFGAHWDEHDTVIVPVSGRKRWTVFAPVAPSPQHPWFGSYDVSDERVWSGELEPGTALVIPRGWGHRVEGSSDLSVHYTISLNRLEVHNLYERLAFEAGHEPLLRADIPYDLDGEVLAYDQSVFDDPDDLGEALGALVSPDMVDRALASHRARIRRRPFDSLAATFVGVVLDDWSGLAARMDAPAGVMVAGEDDESFVVAFDNRLVHLPVGAAPAFCALASGRPVRLEDLPPVLHDGAEVRSVLVRELARAGFASIVHAGDAD